MWTLLAALTLTPAAAEPVEPVRTETLSLQEYRRLARDLAAEDERYRMGRRLHRAGNVTTVAGVAVFPAAIVMAFHDCGFLGGTCNSAVNTVGTGLMLAGAAGCRSSPRQAHCSRRRLSSGAG